jgi:hypothetical protein
MLSQPCPADVIYLTDTVSVRFQTTVKQGYLWKRSNNLRQDWKRRFFFIRVWLQAFKGRSVSLPIPHGARCNLREGSCPTRGRMIPSVPLELKSQISFSRQCENVQSRQTSG